MYPLTYTHPFCSKQAKAAYEADPDANPLLLR